MENYIGTFCPACGKPFQETDEVQFCTACGKVYHKTCWTQNNGCVDSTCSCHASKAPAAAPAPAATAPAPAPAKKVNKAIGYIIGLVSGILSILFSFIILGMDVGTFESSKSYGGDAYTGMQNASAQAANNVMVLCELVQFGFFAALLVAGLALIGYNLQKMLKKSND